jgi:hypothetical protein
VDLLLNNIQGIVFFIGFTRAFASIRRKMMLNILMQVKFLYKSGVRAISLMLQSGYGFF